MAIYIIYYCTRKLPFVTLWFRYYLEPLAWKVEAPSLDESLEEEEEFSKSDDEDCCDSSFFRSFYLFLCLCVFVLK